MNTTIESIPTTFAPETAFALSLRTSERQEILAEELPVHVVLDLTLNPDREWRGIPHSALND